MCGRRGIGRFMCVLLPMTHGTGGTGGDHSIFPLLQLCHTVSRRNLIEQGMSLLFIRPAVSRLQAITSAHTTSAFWAKID
jgi:hypothetical protein